MTKPEEVGASAILAMRYGLPRLDRSVPLTIHIAIRLALVEVLKIGERPSEERFAKLARKFNTNYGIYDAEHLLESPYKIPLEARISDTLILFSGTILSFNHYHAIPALFWASATQQFLRQAFWFDSANSLSRGYFLIPSP